MHLNGATIYSSKTKMKGLIPARVRSASLSSGVILKDFLCPSLRLTYAGRKAVVHQPHGLQAHMHAYMQARCRSGRTWSRQVRKPSCRLSSELTALVFCLSSRFHSSWSGSIPSSTGVRLRELLLTTPLYQRRE